MATYYTQPILDGDITDLKGCLLRFLGFESVTQVKYLTVPDFYQKTITEHEHELAHLEALDEDEKISRTEQFNTRNTTDHQNLITKTTFSKARVVAMLTQVEAWHPQTPKETEFKRLVLRDLTEARDGEQWLLEHYTNPPVPITPEEWYTHALANTRESIQFYQQRLQEETERIEGHNTFLRGIVALP